jgi:uncharacterized membrane protein YadS
MREIRFFGMEHITMMVIAVTVLTLGSIKTRKQKTSREKFKTQLTWFGIAFIIIFFVDPMVILPLHEPAFVPILLTSIPL